MVRCRTRCWGGEVVLFSVGPSDCRRAVPVARNVGHGAIIVPRPPRAPVARRYERWRRAPGVVDALRVQRVDARAAIVRFALPFVARSRVDRVAHAFGTVSRRVALRSGGAAHPVFRAVAIAGLALGGSPATDCRGARAAPGGFVDAECAGSYIYAARVACRPRLVDALHQVAGVNYAPDDGPRIAGVGPLHISRIAALPRGRDPSRPHCAGK